MTNEEKLAILEEGHNGAVEALDALKAEWAREDEVIAARRATLLEAHAQGDRDRDAVRVALGGTSRLEVLAEMHEEEPTSMALSIGTTAASQTIQISDNVITQGDADLANRANQTT